MACGYCDAVTAGTGYQLRMSAEIAGWLADLQRTGADDARAAGQALVALMGAGSALGPPLAVPIAGLEAGDWLMEALDLAYDDRLEQLRELRLRLAGEASGEPAGAAQSAPDAGSGQRELAGQLQQAQADADAFRIRKEVLKASYVALQSMRKVREAMAEWPQDDQLAGDREAPESDEARLRDIIAEMQREAGAGAAPDGLMELRPGTPGAGSTRIIFAIEPPGTALLIGVAEGLDADENLDPEAARISADVLHSVRAGEDPQASEVGFEDASAFLAEFFPDQAEGIMAGAVALAEQNRADSGTQP
jgi:hypothetical protein